MNLAQKTIVTALSLAREQIPTVIAAYDQSGVKLVTQTLQPHQIVVQSLEITKKITIFETPSRYLYRPDVGKLRVISIASHRLQGIRQKALAQLLSVEYANILNNIAFNPATKAINQAMKNTNQHSTFVVVSRLNHDADAIEANRFLMTKKRLCRCCRLGVINLVRIPSRKRYLGRWLWKTRSSKKNKTGWK